MTAPDRDPTLPIIADMLGRETKRAALALKRGDWAYGRSILRSVPGYCIACHTRNSTGPQFSKVSFEPTSTGMSSLEKGEFFAASRQFDRAQDEFSKVIHDAQIVERQPFDWERAVRLMAKAREMQKYPVDRTADVLYLRTSAATHDLLQAAPVGPHLGEALLLAGLSYEILSPLKAEDLHEIFYEACV